MEHFNTFLATADGFEPGLPIAIAVSGGADSMALLLMAQEQGANPTALTVDHGLRPEAKEEARQVAQWCGARGIEHHILTLKPSPHAGEGWVGGSSRGSELEPPPTLTLPLKGGGKITQAAARDARYRLLTDWCKAHNIGCLMTAHHRGDQAETLFFRLARGSDLRGLSCIAPTSMHNGITLLRPLLDTGKQSLIEYLRAKNQPWIEDPSNQNPRYTRNVIRAQLQALPNAEDIERRAAKVAQAFGRIRARIDQKVQQAFAQTVTLQDTSAATIDAGQFAILPPEIARLMLAQLITTLTGDPHPPRTEKLERLCQAMQSGLSQPQTLAHLAFSYEPKTRHFHVRRT